MAQRIIRRSSGIYRAATSIGIFTVKHSVKGWEAHYRPNEGSESLHLGTFGSILDAQRSAHQKHKELVPESRDKLVWNVPPRPAIEQFTSRRYSILSVLIGTISIAVAASGVFSSWDEFRGRSRDAVLLLQAEVTVLRKENAEIKQILAASTTAPQLQDKKLAAQVTLLQNQISVMQEHLAAYEIALGDDPAKKLALPMLKKDIDVIRDEHKADVANLQAEFSRTLDLMKWLFGLLGLGSIISGLGGLLKKSGDSKKSQEAG